MVVYRGWERNNPRTWIVLLTWLSIHGADIPDIEERPGFPEAVRSIALASEWIGEWEQTPGLCVVRDLRCRCEGMPSVAVLVVMPPEVWLDRERMWAADHVCWLEQRQEVASSPREWWFYQDWIDESKRLQRLYYAISYAHCYLRQKAPLVDIRELLGEAEQIIGWADLRVGRLPPVVPVWRFQRIE